MAEVLYDWKGKWCGGGRVADGRTIRRGTLFLIVEHEIGERG